MENSRNADTGSTLWESWDGWFKDLDMRRIKSPALDVAGFCIRLYFLYNSYF